MVRGELAFPEVFRPRVVLFHPFRPSPFLPINRQRLSIPSVHRRSIEMKRGNDVNI